MCLKQHGLNSIRQTPWESGKDRKKNGNYRNTVTIDTFSKTPNAYH